jgi:ubiquinone/menaquinone biosynthesis C-methylase UbiE
MKRVKFRNSRCLYQAALAEEREICMLNMVIDYLQSNHSHNPYPLMSFIDHLLSYGAFRKAIWKRWYPYLTMKLKADGVTFLNYAFETDPPMNIPLTPEDEPNRACIQLYHHVGTQANLQGKHVLEVSCGHGGGASYLTRTLKPVKYTGLDLNPSGIRFCKRTHKIEGLAFIQGDAEDLPFPDAGFDSVINVEASHCYPDFPKFLTEVARVLAPGGYFHYADFRFRDGCAKWEEALENAPLKLIQTTDISSNVLCGMEANSARSMQLLEKNLPAFLKNLGRDFAGVKGSRIYEDLANGGISYRSYCFQKI